ncbi:MAG TPA: peptidylprolyl isomerase [Rhodanobacteraceae bacterium]
MIRSLIVLAAAGLLASPSAFAGTPTQTTHAIPSVKAVVDAAKPSAWRTLDPANTLYMLLPHHHRVIIELAPAWAPAHVANIKTMVREHYFDGTSIYRVQDNFVAQWGDPDGDNPAKAKSMGAAKATLPPEFTRAFSPSLHVTPLTDGDVYAPRVGLSRGLPMAWNPKTHKAWLVQCYGMVGVARDVDPKSGNGNTLYVPIGQAPRRLDHQLAVVGRVIEGMQWLSALPRGPKPMGFYKNPALRTPIISIRLASQMPAKDRVKLQVLRTDSPAFARVLQAVREHRSAFYKQPIGHVSICNVPLPVREVH